MWGALIGAGASLLGSQAANNYSVGSYSTMTPEQQTQYNAMLQGISNYNPNYVGSSSYTPTQYSGGYTPTQYQGGYNVTQAPTNYTPQTNQYQTMMQGALTGALSGQPSTTVNAQTTEDYYRNSIENPALKQYEEQTRPAWMQKTSNIHSSARDTQEQQGYEDLYSNLQSQRANLMYQDEQSRRGLAESAAQRQMTGLGVASGMSSAEQQQALQAAQLGQQGWATQNQLGLSAADQQQQAWYNQNQLGLNANQQNMSAWQAYNQMGLSADQNQLAYQQAQLQQSALPYQLGIQALGIQGMENIAYPTQSEMMKDMWGNVQSALPGMNSKGAAGSLGASSLLGMPTAVPSGWSNSLPW